MLYDIIVGPLEAVVRWIFNFIINKFPSVGVIGAICGVSIAINILALPLYNIAESIQEKERQINKKLDPRVKRIKKGFKGDEQFMMLSEYYRQNGYHPLYSLRGSLSILIEIPFFIAAYSYLSSSSILKESSFWIFSNLGEPDRLFSITLGSLIIPVNILPIIMTAINFVSGYIYTRSATKRDKIQLYAMGFFFLVLLYNSPSGLVIYWICNNIFSLVKTIVLKTKHPGRILHSFVSLGLLGAIYMLRNTNRKKLFLLSFCTIIFISWPYLLKRFREIKSKYNIELPPPTHRRFTPSKTYFYIVLSAGTALALLCGLLLPSSTIATSPEEFSYIGNVTNPTSFVSSSLYFFLGLFVFWPLVIYKMFGEKTKRTEALVLFTILVAALCDVFFFNIEYGTLTTQFKLVKETNLDASTVINTLGPFIVGAITIILFLIIDTYGRTGIFSFISLTIIIAELAVGITKINQIDKRFSAYSVLKEAQENSDAQEEGIYTLSKGGKNVVVIFLDRAVNSLFPYAMEQMEGLKEQYEGFTYYPNTVSFGNVTVIGSPAMMGGYEYTPNKMNEREGFLQDLHNEASTLAPILFSNAGYSVTVTDPPFPNYSTRHDLSAFSSIENVKTGEMYDKFLDRYISKFVNYNITDEELTSLTENGAVNFSILQIIPNIFRMTFYCNCFDFSISNSFSTITDTDAFKWLSALYYLDESTSFTESGNTYTFIGNELTHNPILLDSELLAPATDDDTFDSIVPKTSQNAINHYSSFCAALKQIGRWIDYLKENDCYDNTRIIITSDHGTDIDTGISSSTMSTFMPLLLVKDFNARGELETDETFMTNADTLFLSTEGLEEITMVNPYTGKDLVEEKENGATVYGIYADEWNAPDLIGRTEFTIEKGYAYHVSGNALDSSAWIPLLEWEEMMR